MQRLLAVMILALAFAAPAWAETGAASAIEVVHPWARATLAGTRTGAVYLTLVNKGAGDDRLIGISTPVAAEAKLHRDILDQGVMKMRPVASLEIKAGSRVALSPGKYHVMLMGLKQVLKPGDRFPLILDFAKAGARQVSVEVVKATARDGGMSGMGSTGGMQMSH